MPYQKNTEEEGRPTKETRRHSERIISGTKDLP